MRTIQGREMAAATESRKRVDTLRLAPAFDSDRAAEALFEFLEEARQILDGIESAYARGHHARPAERARRDILRFLAEAEDEVELHDLPSISGLGIGLRRSYVEEMAQQGLLTVRKGEAYPNMLYLEITAAGKEELRRLGVREAMVWLHGMDSRVGNALGQARGALDRLVAAIGA